MYYVGQRWKAEDKLITHMPSGPVLETVGKVIQTHWTIVLIDNTQLHQEALEEPKT
jgi:hypothetical protein